MQSTFNAELALARPGALGPVLQRILHAMMHKGLLGRERFDALEGEASATTSAFQATGDSRLQVGAPRLEDGLRGFFAAVSRRGQAL